MAPPIIPKVNDVPAQTILRINNRIPAINSKVPIAIHPAGSKPTCVKM